MHIGGMRTAIYNWIYAKQRNGQFILRIDDTDRARHVENAVEIIKYDMGWMGLDWSEIHYQSQRTDLYTEAINTLLDNGQATKIDGVVKLKVDPNWTAVVFIDHIRGRIEFPCAQYAEGIPLCRADGSPLYNLATVVDDHHMGITDVIRAEEHISNIAPQYLIAEALGYIFPSHAHIPFVKEPGTNLKFSKRSAYKTNPRFKKLVDVANRLNVDLDPSSVEFYARIGVLPIALFNALVRTGWSLDGTTEYLSRDEIIQKFSLTKVSKSAAEFDPDKLLAYQAHWMNRLSVAERTAVCSEFYKSANAARLEKAVGVLGQRLRLCSDISEYPEFFVKDTDIQYDPKVYRARITNDPFAVQLLADYVRRITPVEATDLNGILEECLRENGATMGQIVHALRVAITGKASGPNIVECMQVIGKDASVQRINLLLGSLQHPAT